MSASPLAALVCCDLGAIVRGRSLPAAELERHFEQGVGWVPANHALTPIGTLAEPNPFGSTGDLRLLPDRDAHVRVEPLQAHSSALELVLCDIVETDGQRWACCPRSFLRESLAELEAELGLRVLTSFEHEFQLIGDASLAGDAPLAPPFSLLAQRAAEPFASRVMGALGEAGVGPERFMPEYAAHQFEIPVEPAEGVTAADRAIALREVVREVARREGMRASFSPLTDAAGAGNGVHVHMSLIDRDGRAVLYDASRPAALSELGGQFAAGILLHADALSALSAPSPVSAARLRPHRWSAGAVCLGAQNRETLLRIPPLVPLGGAQLAGQLRLEYRGADAAANPYLALGAIVRAGLDGVRQRLQPAPILDRDPAQLDEREAESFRVGGLPDSLQDAMRALARDEIVREWMSPLLHEAYVCVKRSEIEAAEGADLNELCGRYAAIY